MREFVLNLSAARELTMTKVLKTATLFLRIDNIVN